MVKSFLDWELKPNYSDSVESTDVLRREPLVNYCPAIRNVFTQKVAAVFSKKIGEQNRCIVLAAKVYGWLRTCTAPVGPTALKLGVSGLEAMA